MSLTIEIRIYSAATHRAITQNQTVGPKSDYYVTLEQLEQICQNELAGERPTGREDK